MKSPMTDEDGIRASELEAEFAELGAGRRSPTPAAFFRAWAFPRSITMSSWPIWTAVSR